MRVENERMAGFLSRLDTLPVMPWKSAKTGQITALVRDLDLVVVKVNKGEGR